MSLVTRSRAASAASITRRCAATSSDRAAAFDAVFKDQPIARDGDAEDDIAPVVSFLLSDDCRYMTGETLMVDGGGFMRA